MTESSVALLDNRIVITNLVITGAEVIEYAGRYADEDKPKAIVRALEVGVSVLERYDSSRNMDFLRQQAEGIITGFNGALQNIPARLEDELIKKLGTGDGQALAPIAALVGQTDKVLRDKLHEVHTLLNDHIDPRRADSTIGCALERLKIILDPKHDDSVQKAVDKSLRDVAGEEGAVASVVKRVVAEAIKPLKDGLDNLAKEVHSNEAVCEALEQTPAKGRPFEEDLLPIVRTWATMVGAEVHHVGPDNQAGDILLIFDSSRMTATDLRIVIEARDDQCARGRKRIVDGMAVAMSTRTAGYGLYVAKTASGLAKEIGEWSELQCQQGPLIACTAEHLRTALRFALAEHTIRQFKSAAAKADSAAIEAELARIRSALSRVRTINTRATAVRSGIDSISTEAAEMKREITESLNAVEEALRVATTTQNAPPTADAVDAA